ncbi:MAG: methyltransferase domain-containing protein [Planctomycetes bacterium]|nr:methyltransferase domain-containing protein [Planctomycetota bacterium]
MSVREVLARMLKNIAYHNIGYCNVCGRISFFICTDAKTARNNMHCIFCRSSSRKRHVAKMALWKLAKKTASIAAILKNASQLKIYNTDTSDAFSKILSRNESYTCSDFFPGVNPGTQVKERVFCQDIENLSFPDESFDLVITEDVLEHIRDYRKALNEIRRVLKPDGYHIFTIPFSFDSGTIAYIDIVDGKEVQVMPPEFHGDWLRGKIAVYRKFGTDLFGILDLTGFETSVNFSRCVDRKYGIVDSFVFISRKTA